MGHRWESGREGSLGEKELGLWGRDIAPIGGKSEEVGGGKRVLSEIEDYSQEKKTGFPVKKLAGLGDRGGNRQT